VERRTAGTGKASRAIHLVGSSGRKEVSDMPAKKTTKKSTSKKSTAKKSTKKK
jgi:hypothetical protein